MIKNLIALKNNYKEFKRLQESFILDAKKLENITNNEYQLQNNIKDNRRLLNSMIKDEDIIDLYDAYGINEKNTFRIYHNIDLTRITLILKMLEKTFELEKILNKNKIITSNIIGKEAYKNIIKNHYLILTELTNKYSKGCINSINYIINYHLTNYVFKNNIKELRR